MKISKGFLIIVCVCAGINSIAQTTLFNYGSSWKYLDNGSNQGTAWRTTSFSDASWTPGNGQLGYGDGDEATIVSYGADANNKYITTYFRKTITITDATAYSAYSAAVKRDDGIIVYINGTEVYRNNMPAGTVANTTLASAAVSDDGTTAQTFSITPSSFVSGNNTIAVEIHQNAGNSSDISFDMQLTATPVPTSTTLISYGSSWKYLDNGTNQGTLWRALAFADLLWSSGNSQLGYGDGDEATILSYGSNANNKYITTYFRKTITIANLSLLSNFTANVKRDDGIVVYVNGSEVYRNNMPNGNISYTTLASAAAGDDGNTAQAFTIAASKFVTGINMIAVEMHQNDKTSSDLSFDMELKATTQAPAPPPSAALTRGPYMNSVTQNSIVIRWRTDIATNSKVSFGPTAGSTAFSITDNTSTTEHVVSLTGLLENTLYYYSIGSAAQILQGDNNNYFKTMPSTGSTQKVRVLAMGDMGNNSTNQINLRNAYTSYNTGKYTDIWMLMGDNAYNAGTDSEYQSNFFNIYQNNLTKNHVLWPSPGNHDYANSAARQADHVIPYYDIFSLPKLGEAGGLASNTEAYYSYNYGNIHFVALDSYGLEAGNTRFYDTLGPQAVWLKQDLAANTQKWTVVYFHHPPYTKGSHNSDTEAELISIRNNLVRIFERYNVDMVINGHSHVYERSFLLNGHYGLETSYNSSYALSSSSGMYNGSANSCLYIKNPGAPKNGIVYAVVGSSGQVGGSAAGYPHNAMYYSNNTVGGAMILEIEGNRLDAKWLGSDGVLRDSLTIMKDVNTTTNISSDAGTSQVLTASWTGSYVWGTGQTTRSITVAPTVNSIYSVRDANNCLTDVFNIAINGSFAKTDAAPKTKEDATLKLYPSIATAGSSIKISAADAAEKIHALVFDMQGRKISEFNFTGSTIYNTYNLKPGTYRIRFAGKEKISFKDLIIIE